MEKKQKTERWWKERKRGAKYASTLEELVLNVKSRMKNVSMSQCARTAQSHLRQN